MRNASNNNYAGVFPSLALISSAFRMVGLAAQLSCVLSNRLTSHTKEYPLDLTSIAIILVCYRLSGQNNFTISPKWGFFITKPGKFVLCGLCALSLLNIFIGMENISSKVIGVISTLLTILSLCLNEAIDLPSDTHHAFYTNFSRSTINHFRESQLKNKSLTVTCLISVLLYAILLAVFFYKTNSQQSAFIGLVTLLFSALFYCYIENIIVYMELPRPMLYLLTQILIFYKFALAYFLVWVMSIFDFATLPKLKAFGYLISIFLWTIAFLELIASKVIYQQDPAENAGEGREDQSGFEFASLKYFDLERLALFFTMIFGVMWFVFINNFGAGLSSGLFGFSIILLVELSNYDMQANYFGIDQGSSSSLKNSWKKALKTFLSGQVVYFLKNEADHTKIPSHGDEVTLYFTLYYILNVIGLLTSGTYWGIGVLRARAYAKKNATSADSIREEESQIVFSVYKVRTTHFLKSVSSITNVVLGTASLCSTLLSLFLVAIANRADSPSVSRYCVISWIALTTLLLITHVVQKVAFPTSISLTRTLLKGVVYFGLGLSLRLLIPVIPSDRASNMNSLLMVAKRLTHTSSYLYLLGGCKLILLHGGKLEKLPPTPNVMMGDESTTQSNQQVVQENTAGEVELGGTMRSLIARRRRINRLISNRRYIIPSSGSQKPETKQKAGIPRISAENFTADHFTYYKAFSALAKAPK